MGQGEGGGGADRRTARQAAGDQAEAAVARHLRSLGWSVVARNVRVGRTELDIVALEPEQPAAIVVVEVRSRSGQRFGTALESVDSAKVARLYAAAWQLARNGCLPDGRGLPGGPPRVDLVCVVRSGQQERTWRLDCHLRGLTPD